MQIVHALSWYLPDSSGGTESYVADLVRSLGKKGVTNTVVAAREGFESASYTHDAVNVFRYPVHPNPNLKQIRGTQPYGGFESFRSWLSQQKADVYHQHSLIGGCDLHHLRVARELGLRTVLTIHIASAICLRGTMMLRGEIPCDGEVRTVRCSECWGISRGMGAAFAGIAARLPDSFSEACSERESSLASAFATKALVKSHLRRLREIESLTDRTVAISQWLHRALLLNGFPKSKVTLSPSGGPERPHLLNISQPKPTEVLRIGYLGRWDKLKGVDLLVRALKKLPGEVKVELTIHGLPGNEQEENYKRLVQAEAGSDQRIQYGSFVNKEDLPNVLGGFDVIAVPSQLLETGPLIALEAHAAGVPVIGSNLGGLAERIRDGIDGLLVPSTDENAWTAAILRLAKDKQLLQRLREGIRPVRTMDDVATDMISVYSDLLNARSTINAA